MKPQYLLRAFLVTGLVFLLFLPAQGQITITKSDIENATAVGTTGTGYLTQYGLDPVVHIGPASGTAQTWDFRSYTFNAFNSVEYIDPSTAPHIASFPQTNVVLRQFDDAAQMKAYSYNHITDAGYLCIGTGDDSDTNMVLYNPPLNQMKLPMTFGTSWTYTGLPRTTVSGMTVQNSCKYTVDAFGTLQLPEGDFQALRLRAEYLTDMKSATISALQKGLAYQFFTKALHYVYIYCDTNDLGKEDVQVAVIGYQFGSNTAAVESQNQSDRAFALKNFPNPFSRQTTISFQLAVSGYVTLKVYDALGRLVRNLFEGRESAGSHSVGFDASQLPTGVYFYRLSMGDKTTCVKAIVRR